MLNGPDAVPVYVDSSCQERVQPASGSGESWAF